MPRLMLLSLAAGTALAAVLVAATGWADVARAVAAVGWALAAVVAVRLVEQALAALAWACLLGLPEVRRPGLYIGVRLIRESINALLPVLQVGGDLAGARLLVTRGGVPAGPAAASVLVDMLIQAGTQFLFTLAGFAALVAATGDGPVVRWVGLGLLLFAPALVGFFLAQRYGLFHVVEGWVVRAGERWPKAHIGPGIDLHGSLQALYARPRGLVLGTALHLLGWLVGVGEIWIALAAMGHQPGFLAVLVIDSLSQAVRGAAFAVPGAIGVQEGGFLLLGALYGLPPDASLALSLVRRVPDLAVGLPGLLAWQLLEAGRPRPVSPAPLARD